MLASAIRAATKPSRFHGGTDGMIAMPYSHVTKQRSGYERSTVVGTRHADWRVKDHVDSGDEGFSSLIVRI
jgi:hypothetical protein